MAVQMDEETVMGYPAYAFDPLNQMPLNQMPAPGQHQATKPFDPLGQYYEQDHQQPYTVPGERPIYFEKCNGNCQVNPQNYHDCRRCARMHGRGERRTPRCGNGRRCGHRRCYGPVGLVRMIVLGPVVMGLRQLHRHLEHK